MSCYSNKPRIESFVLWATNTGEMHEQHVRMARGFNMIATWEHHVSSVLVPMYVRECHGATIMYSERREAAECLRTYYNEYITEF